VFLPLSVTIHFHGENGDSAGPLLPDDAQAKPRGSVPRLLNVAPGLFDRFFFAEAAWHSGAVGKAALIFGLFSDNYLK